MTQPSFQHNPSDQKLPALAMIIAALAAMFALAVWDVVQGTSVNTSIAYPTVLLACWMLPSRRFLWSLTALGVVLTFAAGFWEETDSRAVLHRMMAVCGLLVTAGVFHHLLGSWALTKRTADELSRANSELTAREREIATQNEELRSQTEELERQSEELRVANDELARRERTLEALLRLSRALTAELSRSDTLDRICQALAEMVNGPNLGVGVKLREGDFLRLHCNYGFGPAGPKHVAIPYDRSFGRLVLERNHTGYLEDIGLRPDLEMPQPMEGEPFRSILAAPLRVNGHAVGTLEVYSRDRRTWSDEQISMVESLAAQTSISLQAAELFERVEQQRRRFETIFRTLPIGVAVVDTASGMVTYNSAAVLLLGVPPEVHISQRRLALKFKVYRRGAELSHEDAPLIRAMRGEDVYGEEIDLIFDPARRVTLLTGAAPIRAPGGAIEGAIVAFTDITAIKSLQHELDARRRAAEESSVRKTRFLAQVSHDIRNPANAINLLAELLHRTASDPARAADVPAIAGDLKKNSLSLVALVTDILDITRMDVGRIELEEAEFSLNELLTDECRGYQEMASAKKLDFVCEFPPNPLVVRSDRVKLSRVVGNLVGNAVKFTQSGGIRVIACTGGTNGDAHKIEIRVEDTGPGIAPEFHERIFDEFFQLRNGNEGAGLGLAICKRLVEAMGGDIKLQSTPGKGSTFTLVLPSTALVRSEK